MNDNDMLIVDSFSKLIAKICIDLGEKDVRSFDFDVNEMRPNMAGYEAFRDGECHYCPLDYHKKAKKLYGDEYDALIREFDDLAYYNPSEAKKAFAELALRHFRAHFATNGNPS